MAGTDGGIPGRKQLSRREFLGFDKFKDIFRDPLDRAGHILQNRLNQFSDKKLHIVNSAVPRSLSGEATFSLAIPEPQGIGTVTNLLPTLGVDEELVHMIGLISKRIIAPIAFGLSGSYVGFEAGVTLANKSLASTLPPSVGSGQKDKAKKKSKYTRREAILGGVGAVAGAGISEALLACNLLTPDNQNFTNYDSTDYQRTSLVNQPLSETVSPPDIERAPHATELIAELKRAVEIAKPDVSLYRTFVDYNYTKNRQTGSEFEMAFVKVGSQTDHIVVNGQERLLDEDIYMVSYIGPDGKPIARVAIWSEIPDQAGAKAFGLHLADATADANLLPNFKKPLLEYVKKDGEDKIRVGFFNPVTYEINDIARFTLNQPDEFSFLKALSIIFNPFAVQPVEAAELIPSATPGTTKPTVIATATATVTLEPTRSASPVPMIEVGGLKIPDPKASNPEFFDLTSPGSPIVQFANTMKMGGFEVNLNQIAEELTKNYQVIKGVDGKNYALTTYTLIDKNGTDYTMGLIADQGEDGKWGWKDIHTGNVSQLSNVPFGLGNIMEGKYYYYKFTPEEKNTQIELSRVYSFGDVFQASAILWKGEGKYDWTRPDAFINLLKNTGRIRGGHLVWDKDAFPDWFNDLKNEAVKNPNAYRERFISILSNYIKEAVSRYKDNVHEWSVLNEIVGPDGNLDQNNFWVKIIGPDLPRIAIKAIREADPTARIIVNEFGVEFSGPKSDGYYNLIKSLKEKELLTDNDIVGFQFHISAKDHKFDNPAEAKDQIKKNLRRFIDLGLKVAVTELDVMELTSDDPQSLIKQAAIYKTVIDACFELNLEYSKPVCDSIVVWGLKDDSTWLHYITDKPSYPLLFNKKGKPNPSYYAILGSYLKYLSTLTK